MIWTKHEIYNDQKISHDLKKYDYFFDMSQNQPWNWAFFSKFIIFLSELHMISNYIFILDALAKFPAPPPWSLAKCPLPDIIVAIWRRNKSPKRAVYYIAKKRFIIFFPHCVYNIGNFFRYFWSIILCVFLSFFYFFNFLPQKIVGYLKEKNKPKTRPLL